MSIIGAMEDAAGEGPRGKAEWAGSEEPRTGERPAPLGCCVVPTWLKESEGV